MCNGNCNQGRMCDCMPDIDPEDGPPREPMNPAEALFLCLIALLSALLVIGLVASALAHWFPPIP